MKEYVKRDRQNDYFRSIVNVFCKRKTVSNTNKSNLLALINHLQDQSLKNDLLARVKNVHVNESDSTVE